MPQLFLSSKKNTHSEKNGCGRREINPTITDKADNGAGVRLFSKMNGLRDEAPSSVRRLLFVSVGRWASRNVRAS